MFKHFGNNIIFENTRLLLVYSAKHFGTPPGICIVAGDLLTKHMSLYYAKVSYSEKKWEKVTDN